MPRLARRVRVADVAVRVDKGTLEGLVTSFELRGVAAEGYLGESGNFVKSCGLSYSHENMFS